LYIYDILGIALIICIISTMMFFTYGAFVDDGSYDVQKNKTFRPWAVRLARTIHFLLSSPVWILIACYYIMKLLFYPVYFLTVQKQSQKSFKHYMIEKEENIHD